MLATWDDIEIYKVIHGEIPEKRDIEGIDWINAYRRYYREHWLKSPLPSKVKYMCLAIGRYKELTGKSLVDDKEV